MSLVVTARAGANEVRPNEVLSFNLGHEEYGIAIEQVHELRGYDAVTRIANTAASIKGVINLRGAIVPIVDLRICFGTDDPPYDQFTVVVIVQVGSRVLGLVVDSVSDVVAITVDQLKPAPQLGSAMDTGYLVGVATVAERMLQVLDLERLLSADELNMTDAIAA